jgi:hypothetical protein
MWMHVRLGGGLLLVVLVGSGAPASGQSSPSRIASDRSGSLGCRNRKSLVGGGLGPLDAVRIRADLARRPPHLAL